MEKMCCHEFLARLLLGKDHGQGKAASFARVYEQAAEGPSGPQTANDWYTTWAQQVWQDRSADQHDSGAVQGMLRKNPHIQPHDGWRPVKKYIEETMKAPVDREQTYFEEWDEPALRQIIRQQRKITETSKQLKMRSLFQILIVIDDFADNPHLHKRSGDSALDTLFARGRHFQISTLVSTQKLRLVSNAVRVNSQFFCIWRLRNQLEKDSLLEELTALAPKPQLEAMYEAAVAEPYSFLYIYLLKQVEKMFDIRFERVFQLGNGTRASSSDGAAPGDGLQQAAGQQHAVPERVQEH